MKKLAILLIGVTLVLFGCKKKDLDQPEITHFPDGNVWTVGQILDTLTMGTYQFDKEWNKDAIVKGYVIADETGGNIYRTFYLRGEDGRCIAVYRKGSSDGGSDSYNVKTGDYIGYKLEGSIISEYMNLPQIQVQEHDVNKLIVIYERNCTDKVKPINTTIERINAGEHLCDLVKLSDVQFEQYEGLTYADGQSNTNRTLVSCDGNSIIVRTSGYANFAAEPLPEGRGTLTSIVSLYGSTWQLLLRNTQDVKLNEGRCGEGGDLMELPYGQSFASSFGTYMTYNVLGDQVWTIDHNTAKMTAKVGNDIFANEDWLISSPINMTGDNVVMKIEYLARYFTNFSSELKLMVSEDYEYGEDPSGYTWTNIPVEWENVSDWNTFLTPEIVLDEYIGKNITVAVKYVSQAGSCGTIEIKSIKVENGVPTPPPAVIFSEPFSQSQGEFVVQNVFLSQGLSFVWKFNSDYGMVASAFTNNTSYESESWLISPAIDLNGYASAVLSFDHAANKLSSGTPAQYYTVWVSTDYTEGLPDTATWTQLVVPNYPPGNNWTFVASGDIDMSAYLGNDNVHFAFKYTSENGNSGSWEIKNVLIKE